MAKHQVTMRTPALVVSRADAKFNVYADGQKFGTLHISQGSAVWFPRNRSYGHKLGWKKLDQVFKDEGTRFEKRKR